VIVTDAIASVADHQAQGLASAQVHTDVLGGAAAGHDARIEEFDIIAIDLKADRPVPALKIDLVVHADRGVQTRAVSGERVGDLTDGVCAQTLAEGLAVDGQHASIPGEGLGVGTVTFDRSPAVGGAVPLLIGQVAAGQGRRQSGAFIDPRMGLGQVRILERLRGAATGQQRNGQEHQKSAWSREEPLLGSRLR
jgi:hypothetical protein